MGEKNSKHIMSLRLSKETSDHLEKVAEAMGRSKSYVAAEAIQTFCDAQSWQLQAIEKGIDDADSGHLFDHQSVKSAWVKKAKGTNKRA